jgi:3-phenylpropionate/trans-cinnamate dioxygenase ferredoxin reductase subunit
MTARPTHVIVGASLTGAKAAETLRADGYDGRIVMFGAERHRPYERPPLSKQLLRGETGVDDVFVHAADFYERNDIDLLLASRVEEIDVRSRVVTAPGVPSIAYDRLLLATGARPRRLRLPGADLDGIHYLRTLDDNEALRSALVSASRVAVVGAGWIGSEVAASVRQMGLDVALIDPLSVPLARVLGHEIGAVYRDLHTSHGVALHLGTQVEGFVGDNAVAGVRTTDGATIDADVVVVGVGVEPRVELARRAGIGIDGGILVDPLLGTNAPFVFAAGDVAAAWHPSLRRRIRVEHWANAINQGVVAAKNMLDAGLPFDRVPYFFSDQYDFGMEYSGYAPNWDNIVFRGRPESHEFIAFWMTNGRVGAAMNANVWNVAEPLQALIRSGQPVDEARLRDPAVPLDALVAEPRDRAEVRP